MEEAPPKNLGNLQKDPTNLEDRILCLAGTSLQAGRYVTATVITYLHV